MDMNTFVHIYYNISRLGGNTGQCSRVPSKKATPVGTPSKIIKSSTTTTTTTNVMRVGDCQPPRKIKVREGKTKE